LAERATYLPSELKNGTMTLIPEENPYYVFANTWIQKNAKLIIMPGVIIKFKPFYFSGIVNLPTALTIDGDLVANGTAENPIIFTSERDDRFGGDTDADGGANPPTPGSWGALRYSYTGKGAVDLDYVRFYFGGSRASNDANLGGALHWEGSRDLTIKNSVFQNNNAGIHGKDTLSNKNLLTVDGSEFTDNINWGILVFPGNFEIKNSILTGSKKGLYTQVGSKTNALLKNNNIFGNSEYGVQNQGASVLNARENWWGASAGPTHASNPGGAGDKVSDKVDFSGWLSDKIDFSGGESESL